MEQIIQTQDAEAIKEFIQRDDLTIDDLKAKNNLALGCGQLKMVIWK